MVEPADFSEQDTFPGGAQILNNTIQTPAARVARAQLTFYCSSAILFALLSAKEHGTLRFRLEEPILET